MVTMVTMPPWVCALLPTVVVGGGGRLARTASASRRLSGAALAAYRCTAATALIGIGSYFVLTFLLETSFAAAGQALIAGAAASFSGGGSHSAGTISPWHVTSNHLHRGRGVSTAR